MKVELQDLLKESGIKEMLERMYWLDFNDPVQRFMM